MRTLILTTTILAFHFSLIVQANPLTETWSTRFKAGGDELVSQFQFDSKTNAYIAGAKKGPDCYHPYSWLARINSSGKQEWIKYFYSSQSLLDNRYPQFYLNKRNEATIVYYTSGTIGIVTHLARINEKGEVLWDQVLFEDPSAIVSQIVPGESESYLTVNAYPNSPGCALMSIDSKGQVKWTQEVRLSEKETELKCTQLAVKDNRIVFAAVDRREGPSIVSFDLNGAKLWHRPVFNKGILQGLVVAPDKNILAMGGLPSSETVLIKLSSEGNPVFMKPYPSGPIGANMQLRPVLDSDGNLFDTVNQVGAFSGNVYKTSPNGDRLWASDVMMKGWKLSRAFSLFLDPLTKIAIVPGVVFNWSEPNVLFDTPMVAAFDEKGKTLFKEIFNPSVCGDEQCFYALGDYRAQQLGVVSQWKRYSGDGHCSDFKVALSSWNVRLGNF